MPTGSDVRVTFTGDTSQLTAASKQASAAIAATGDAADKAQAQIDALNEESEAVGEKFGKVGGAASKAAGGLSLISPAAGEAAGNLADMADIGELAAEIMEGFSISGAAAASAGAALAVGLAALAAAYAVVGNATSDAENIQRANAVAMLDSEESANKLADALNRVAEAQRGTSKVYGDNAIKIGLLSGALEQYEVDAMAAAQAVRDGTAAEREALQEALRQAEARLDAANKVADSESALAEERAAAIQQQGEMGEAARKLRADLETLNTTTDTQAGIVADLITKKGEQEKADKKAAEAARKGAEAQRRAAEEVKAAEDALAASAKARADAEARTQAFLAERAKAEKDYADALASIRAMESEANADRLTEIEALTAARDEQIAALNRTLTEQLSATEGNELRQQEIEQAGRDARLAIEQRYQRDKGAIVAESNARIADDNAAALAELEAQNRAAADAIYQVSGDLFGSVSDLAGSLMDAGLAKSREGLRALFGVQQAAAVAQAAINTALAVSNALALPLPPPLPQIAAVAAGIAGAAQVAAITSTAPPSFRSGYMPDQQLAFIEPQSEIVAPASAVQALGGRDAARDAFAGMSGGGAPTVTRFTMGHREFSALVQGSARRPGPLRDLTVRPSTSYDPHRKR